MLTRLVARVALGITLVACGSEVVVEDDGVDSSDGSSDVAGNGGAGSTSAGNGAGPSATTTTTSSTSSGTPGGICGSGVTMFDGAGDACLAASCCAAFDECAGSGTNVAECQACLDGSGTGLCQAALDCAAESGCFPNGNDCPSGAPWGAPNVDACLAENCCFEAMYCTKGGSRCRRLHGLPRCGAGQRGRSPLRSPGPVRKLGGSPVLG